MVASLLILIIIEELFDLFFQLILFLVKILNDSIVLLLLFIVYGL
jgi:hypothetical protein